MCDGSMGISRQALDPSTDSRTLDDVLAHDGASSTREGHLIVRSLFQCLSNYQRLLRIWIPLQKLIEYRLGFG